MANLFWKTKNDVRSLLATPFKTEEEFEKTIFTTSELLEDIFVIKRQVRGGGKIGIPDIIGVDYDGNVCIIEIQQALLRVQSRILQCFRNQVDRLQNFRLLCQANRR